MKNKTMMAVNTIIIAAIFVLNYFYQRNGFDFTLKCICSGGFALLGIINFAYAFVTRQSDSKFYIAMSVGLLLAFLGDVLIGYDFIIGAGTFALGHICFIAAYCFLQKPGKIGRWDWTDHACMGTYYPALCMLAYSVFRKAKLEVEDK